MCFKTEVHAVTAAVMFNSKPCVDTKKNDIFWSFMMVIVLLKGHFDLRYTKFKYGFSDNASLVSQTMTDKNKTERFAFRDDAKFGVAINRICHRNGISKSSFFRIAIRNEIKKQLKPES